MVKASAYNAGDLGSIPGSGRSLGCTDDVTAHALMTWLIGH